MDEFNSSNEFNSFYTLQDRRILLHGQLRNKFVYIKFDDCATYEQGLRISVMRMKMMRQLWLLMMKKTKIESVETHLFIKSKLFNGLHVISNCEKIYTNCYCTCLYLTKKDFGRINIRTKFLSKTKFVRIFLMIMYSKYPVSDVHIRSVDKKNSTLVSDFKRKKKCGFRGRINWFLWTGAGLHKNICGFKNIRIRVDGILILY